MDITPIAFIASSSLFLFAILKDKNFDVIPIALENLYNTLPNPIFVLNRNGKIISTNNHAEILMASQKFNNEFSTNIWINSDEIGNNEMIIGDRNFIISKATIFERGNEISGFLVIFTDVSEIRESQERIKYLNFHDHMTDLYNKRYYDNALKESINEENMPLAIISLDVNALKLVNDAFGHDAGDKLLINAANVLKETCNKNHIVARIGGDEFSLIIKNANIEKIKSLIMSVLTKSKNTRVNSVEISFAIGVGTMENCNMNLAEVISQADNSMYRNKLQFGKKIRKQILDNILTELCENYPSERTHIENVVNYSLLIAGALNFSENERLNLEKAASVHDVGKIIIPCEMLEKSALLTEKEYDAVKRHSDVGYQILKSVVEYLPVSEYVLYHHEKWDGTGYPEGLKQFEIPLESRIIAVADAFEAMTGERTYKQQMTKEQAIIELTKFSGTQFDPDIVKTFINKIS